MNYYQNIGTRGSLSNRVLTLDQLRAKAPSVFAETKAHDRGDRYAFIPTIRVVEALMNEGFQTVHASESMARSEEKKGFSKHMLRFRKINSDLTFAVGDLTPELVLTNSHDGTSSYQLNAGIYRYVCSNGMVVSDSNVETIRCRHTGNVIDNVLEGSYRIIEELPKVLNSVESLRGITLDRDEQMIYAKAALQLRYDDDESPIKPQQLNETARMADRAPDLWTTFNRVQEKMIKGGVYGRNKMGGRMRTREVKSVSENLRLNKALWTLTEEFAKLKG